MTAAAANLHARTGHTGGNGSLMRTSPVALAHLGDPQRLTAAAEAIPALTHTDERAGQACVLWSQAIRQAVLDVRVGLPYLSDDARDFWAACIDEAEAQDPPPFTRNGYVVTALQAAWSAIHHAPPRMTCRACTCSTRSTAPSVSAMTPTRSRRSPAACSAPGGAPLLCRRSGARSCTGIRAARPRTSSRLPRWLCEVAGSDLLG